MPLLVAVPLLVAEADYTWAGYVHGLVPVEVQTSHLLEYLSLNRKQM